MSPLDPEIPPAGEEIHLPGPSMQPILLAVGITFAVIGITISPIFLVSGLILTVVILVRWVRDARREMAQLPLEHRH